MDQSASTTVRLKFMVEIINELSLFVLNHKLNTVRGALIHLLNIFEAKIKYP